ncbi:SusC/RagA family TonB-linked outer membrane protein [Capnocytophaga cynodegmi]|uniref:SusC/RagA family TonB-linked outer membrane protein n=1 Tax=Capnocytophaga cynodegmi TaxID=28189 RepID=A0A250E566_9FLAO|nr:SusC/RagA family TonB-linked outer membrane protein [Capnocytophaga cynodegmi]ATA68039.1 SusC/RagA family TonB-linked outer membrane protein [Capnocytophaga cynodegmi]
MKEKLIWTVSFFFLALQIALAQEKTITGVVKDEQGEPLPGITVTIKGTTKGVATDFDGNYKIKAKVGDILHFIGIGLKSVDRLVSASTSKFDVVMHLETEELEEVVVVAYGTADKKSLTGSVALVSAEKISQQQTTDVAKALEGAVAGVTISTESGQPGKESKIRIRGIGSINASNDPLIVLDGVPYSGELSSINNNDIESLSVLKDASSSALYGARGANGVVIITTKKGKKGALSVTLDSKVGFNSRGVPEYDVMTSPSEYYETIWESIYNKAIYTDGKTDAEARALASSADEGGLYQSLGYNIYNVANDQIVDPVTGKINPNASIKYSDAANFNNWTKALFNTQTRKEHNLTVTRGGEKGTFYFSLGYLGDEGYSLNSSFERYSTRFSYNGELLPWLNVNASTMISFTEAKKGTEGGAYSNPFGWTRNIAPIYPVYVHDADGNLVYNKGERVYDFGEIRNGVNLGRAYGGSTNPVATQDKDIDSDINYYLNQTLGFDVSLAKNLIFTATGNFYGNFYEYNYFKTPIGGAGKTYNGIGEKQRVNSRTITLTQLLKYNKTFGNYKADILLGHESYSRILNRVAGEKSNYVDPSNTEWNNAAKITELYSYNHKHAVDGYFGQLNLSYGEKYFLSGSLRRDGSSVFAPENRWGTFWSAGFSWRVDQEKFLKDVSWLDALKLKVSYGVQGNDHLLLPNSASRSWTPYLTLYTITSDGNNPGLSASYKGRREVTWEENANLNAGIEVSLFQNRLSFDFDYFRKKTNNLLFNLPVPETTGFSTEPWNIGNMENKGIEFSVVGTPIKTKNVVWTLNVNGLHYKNKVLSLPEKFAKEGITRNTHQKIFEGGGIYDFYMVKWGGVNPENGDAQYWIADGKGGYELKPSKDYESTHSKQKVGSAIPDLQGGFGTTLNVYGFDLGVNFSYKLGGKILDSEYSGLMHIGNYGDNWHRDILNRWTPTNRNTDTPRLEAENQDINQSSSRFLTDASYIALRNINVGYNFSPSVLEDLKIKKLRVYMAADNVALWSKRKGLDPRQSIAGFNNDATYSPIRTVSAGLLLTL